MQVSAATVEDFLGKVFAQAPAAAAQAAGADTGPGTAACAARSGYAVLSVQQLCAELDARVEVLETLLTYLEVGHY